MPDSDGYPTEEELIVIEQWPFQDGWAECLRYCASLWYYPDAVREATGKEFFDEPCQYFRFATLGWSGNESIIGSMMANSMLWVMTWHMSKRGGLYVFRVRPTPSGKGEER